MGPSAAERSKSGCQTGQRCWRSAGRTDIQIVVGDSASSPQVGVQEALRLIDQEGVSVIVGDLASGVTLAVAQNVTVPNGILADLTGLNFPGTSQPFRITICSSVPLCRMPLRARILAELARELGYQTASTLYVDDSYGQGLSAAFAARFAALGGQVLATVPLETGEPTYLPQLQQATAGDPDVWPPSAILRKP